MKKRLNLFNLQLAKRSTSAAFNLSLIVAFCLFHSPAAAQKVFSIEEAVTMGKGAILAPKTLSGLSWIPGTHTHYHYAKQNDTTCIVFYDVDKRSADTLNLARINFALKQYNGMHRPTQPPLDDLKGVPWIQNWKNERMFRFQSGEVVFLYDIKGDQLIAEHGLEGNMENQLVHTQTGHIAYTVGQNVFVKYVGASAIQVTFDSVEGIVNGTIVHRNEFGINGGLFWSEEGRRLAYYRMDESMVTQYPIYDIDKMPAQGNFVRYPFAGAASHQVTVWAYDSKTNRSVKIKTEGPAEQYLTNISWDPSGKFLYIAVVNRDQDHMWLNKYDAESGDFMFTLFEEKHEKYVEPENPMFWVDDNSFIWQSERDGFNHLYHYTKDGILLKQLTNGNWLVTSLLGKDKKGKYLFFMATKQSPLNNNLYQVDLKSGTVTELSSESGVHTCRVSEDGAYVLDSYSNASTPYIAQRISLKDGAKTIIHKAANPLKDYELGETSVFTLKASDGTDLYCRMIKPTHFDPAKKYPVVVYTYGGPHLQLIRNSWLSAANLWMHYMAQQGYVVFSLDGRGSSNRGLAFENATFKNLGTLEMEDQLVGAKWLKEQSFVDGNRMAVHGWSFGGFLTTSLMTRSPGTFRVGVAGGPVIDWSMYEVMYTERYMDKPSENPEGYKKANLLNYVENLDGKLLIIHGTSDDVVLWQHSLLYVRESINKKVLIDYFVYPEHPHNVLGTDRVHLMRKITEYIQNNVAAE